MSKRAGLITAFGLAALSLLLYYFSFITPQDARVRAEKNLLGLEAKAQVYLDSVYRNLKTLPKKNLAYYLSNNFSETYTREGIACFVYENDSLLYWTDNRVAVENYMLNVCFEKTLVKLKNGYYEVIRHPRNAFSSFQLYALVLIKNNFPYENRYLENGFNAALQLPDNSILTEGEASKTSMVVHNARGQTVFSFDMPASGRRPLMSLLSFLFLCVSAIVFLGFLKKVWRPLVSLSGMVKWSATALSIMPVMGFFLLKLHVLFVPLHWYRDPGDFPFLAFLLVCGALFYWVLAVVRQRMVHVNAKHIFLWGFLAVIFLAGQAINLMVLKIFNRSYLASDLSDIIFSSSLQVYFSYAFLFILMICFVTFCEAFLRLYPFGTAKKHWFALIAVTLIAILVHHLCGQYDILKAVWPAFFFALIAGARKLFMNNRFLYGTLACLFISFFVSYLSVYQKNHVDYEQRLNVARQLANPRDEIAENLFASIKNGLLKDKELLKSIQKKEKGVGDIEQSVLRKYFNGYWDKYHISVCVFDSLCYPLVLHSQNLYNNNSYFDELINGKMVPTTCDKLYFNAQLKDKTFYLFKAPLEDTHKPHFMYLVIESKKAAEYRGFPDLLLSRSVQFSGTEYSYAVYRNGRVQMKQGRFDYPGFFPYPEDKADAWNFQQGGYNHLVYRPNESTRIVVSKSYSYINDLFSTVGFLFLISTTVLLLVNLLTDLLAHRENTMAIKIQYYAALAVVALFIPVAISAVALVKKQTETANTDAIKEKTLMLADYLGVRLADYDQLNESHREYVAYLLAQASDLFKSDVTVFNTNGEYYAASLPKLFEEGLVSKKLNPAVYSRLLTGREGQEVFSESVGKLNFYSAYRPVHNRYGKNLCVVNLPYFSRQGEMQAQLFSYLSALLNIYILAFMIVSLGVALLANWLTRPLRMLQKQFMHIGLNAQEASIIYDKKDEIGLLISAYNDMLVKLQKSADRLAQSEREGAWKEMARQVAHEIKNPLTPMKLSVQHVQRLMETDPKGAAEHMKKIAPILLEEIDALSHIATEFSNFSQLPAPKLESLEMVSFVKSVIPLYTANQKVNLSFVSPESSAFVMADKDQMLRVLNNLVNNAVQAIGDREDGRIILSLDKKNSEVVISVKDNGAGIDGAMKSKIFQPNFSTKSYGTGLGLAMCKRILEQHNGKIWFESTVDQGATFFFLLHTQDVQ